MNRRLSAAQVSYIRQHQRGQKHEALAATYRVSRSTITLLLNGRRWCWCWTEPPRFTSPEKAVP